eukprot:gene57358-78589_t
MIDMKPIMELRGKYKDKFKEVHGVGLGFMSFFTKACAIALKEFPLVNSYIDGDEIVFNDYADIAIAVSAPRGLVVPVIRSAEKLNFAQIESEVVRLAGKARENKLTIEEMTGGTFTITNGGICTKRLLHRETILSSKEWLSFSKLASVVLQS